MDRVLPVRLRISLAFVGFVVLGSIGLASVASRESRASGPAAFDSPRWTSAAPAMRRALARHCSPSGDYCVEVINRRGRIKFNMIAISLRGAYRLCVRDPAGRDECERFRLIEDRDLYVSRIDWQRQFGSRGNGRYSVRWRAAGRPLGPPLAFIVSD